MINIRNHYPFEPDYAVAPGETLAETIDALNMTQKELALRTGLTEQSINRIIKGRQPISSETANKLELVTGVPARMWNNLESQYREQLAKIEEEKRLEADIDWLKEIPYKILIKQNVIPHEKNKKLLLRHVLAFYGVGSVQQYHAYWENKTKAVAARRSQLFESHPGPTSAWIRLGELQAQQIETEEYCKDQFKNILINIRSLTTSQPEIFIPEMCKLCADAGVALSLVPGFPKAPWYGASMWLNPEKAMILLSLRGKYDDQFWFSFFHEASHILNDSKKEMFINEGDEEDPTELRANEFASTMLIPKEYHNRVKMLRSKEQVRALAREIGVCPGIVVGLYQRLTGKYSWFNDLKQKLIWSE